MVALCLCIGNFKTCLFVRKNKTHIRNYELVYKIAIYVMCCKQPKYIYALKKKISCLEVGGGEEYVKLLNLHCL